MTSWDPWNFRERTDDGAGLVGFTVQASDGEIGAVSDVTTELDGAYLVVETSSWLFGRESVVPAGTVERIDPEAREVWLDVTQAQVKDAPDVTDRDPTDQEVRRELADYYGGLYATGT